MAFDNVTAHLRATPMQDRRQGPLNGVRILDVTHAIAGPWCTMMLADLGADVIKVESPAGDMQRFMGPYTREDTERAYGGTFGTYNRNKRAIVLDLKDEADRAVFLQLATNADAVVENQRAGTLEKLGLGYEVLAALNPKLVYGAIRGFGDPRTGESPHVDWPAYDVVAQAMGSLVSQNGTADGETLKVGPFVGDIYPGTVGATTILAALYHAKATGEGQFVDVAMVDAIAALAEQGVMRQSYMGRPTPPSGNRSDFACPFDIYPTADGSCAIAAPNETAWRQLAALIGRPDLATDERTNSQPARVRNRALVDEVVGGWARARTCDEVLAVLGGHVPVGPVRTPEQLFDDPHMAAREMLVAVDQPVGRPVVQVNSPMKFTATPTGVYRRPPRLDEHGGDIRARLAAGEAWPEGD